MKNFIFILFALFIVSCKNVAGDDVDLPNENPTFNYQYGNEVQRNFYGQVLDRNGNPISGAMVSAGNTTTQTNADGFFVLKDATVKENFAHLKVKKSGFIDASRVLLPTNGDNRVNVMMIPKTTTSTISSGVSSTVSLPNGASVKFDGSFKDANGNPYSGNVNVAVFNLVTSDTYFNETMPGSLLASDNDGEARMLESYGMMHVELTGAAGESLQIADGHKAQITVPIDPAQTATAGATIPLWSFNEEMGVWVEEGSATKVGSQYVGNVSHFSWWNCDVSNPLTMLNISVTDADGQPVASLKIGWKTAAMASELIGYTNGNGIFNMLVFANQTVEIKIYDVCSSVIYSGTIGPFANASITNVALSLNNTSTAQTYNVVGNLLDCSGNAINNGYVILNFPAGSNYFGQNLMQLVNSGTFDFTIVGCSINSQFTLTGYDGSNLQSSGNITYNTVAPITNVGNISTCNNINEFLSYSIDGQIPHYILDDFESTVIGPDGSLIIGGDFNTPKLFVFDANSLSILATGLSLTSNYNLRFKDNNNTNQSIDVFTGNGNNITITFNYVGPVGDYIDFVFSGTYMEGTQTGPITHTISGNGHVIRDN